MSESPRGVGRVLVAYSSKMGSTAEIADAIADELRKAGAEVDLSDTRRASPPADYDAVVLGSAVYAARWLGPAKRYLKSHREQLADRPTWPPERSRRRRSDRADPATREDRRYGRADRSPAARCLRRESGPRPGEGSHCQVGGEQRCSRGHDCAAVDVHGLAGDVPGAGRGEEEAVIGGNGSLTIMVRSPSAWITSIGRKGFEGLSSQPSWSPGPISFTPRRVWISSSCPPARWRSLITCLGLRPSAINVGERMGSGEVL
jgi:hypothetical protein